MKKMRGMGYVYQPTWRDKKTGEIRTSPNWWISYSINGKRIREPVNSENRADAVRMLKRQTGRAAQGIPVGPQLEKLTLDDVLAMVEAKYVANGLRSLGRVKIAAVRLRDFFGGARKAHEISTAEITRYQAYRLEQTWHGKRLKPATVNYECCVLRHGLALAQRADKLVKRPHFEMLQVRNVRQGFFEREQLDAVLRHLPEYFQPVAIAAYLTGWRAKSELLTRQWRHVDLVNGWLRLEPGEGKTGQGRAFPFSFLPELQELMVAQRARVSEIERRLGRVIPWVFCYDDGSPILNYNNAWTKARRAAGIPGRVVHDFRRTAVRNLERKDVSQSAAMKLTGHETASVYQRYAIVDEATLQEAVAKLAEGSERPERVKVTAITGRPVSKNPPNLRAFDA
jgi:integrase